MTTPRKRHRPLSHSAREDYKLCPKKFAYGRELRLEPVEKKKSLRMGTAFGLCVEHRDPERAFEGYWDGIPLHERIMDRQSELEIAQVKLLAELYCERYPDHRTYDVVEHEVEFRSSVLGHGFLDGVFENRSIKSFLDGVFTVERTGMEGKLLQKGLFWNDTSRLVLAIDDQVTAYFAAMREIGRPLDKLLYRVTFKPGITQNSKTNEALPAYIERLRGRIADDPSYAFEQHELYRTDAQLDAFLEECAEVNEHVKLSRKRGAFPKNTKSCTMFGGCVFLPICRDESVEGLYRERPLPADKPKLPRLGKVQKAVMLTLSDSFRGGAYAEAVAAQTGIAHARITKVLRSLDERGFACDMRSETHHDPYWMLTDGGRDVAALLQQQEES